MKSAGMPSVQVKIFPTAFYLITPDLGLMMAGYMVPVCYFPIRAIGRDRL